MPRVSQRRLIHPSPLEWRQRLTNLSSPHGRKQIFFLPTVSIKVLWESQFYAIKLLLLVPTPHPRYCLLFSITTLVLQFFLHFWHLGISLPKSFYSFPRICMCVQQESLQVIPLMYKL